MLKGMDEDLYREYLLEAYEDTNPRRVDMTKIEEIASSAPVPVRQMDLVRLTELPSDHPAVVFASGRMIPKSRWRDLYYAYDFRSWANIHVPGRYPESDEPEPRLVIPFWTRGTDRRLVGFQGRLLSGDGFARYLTASLDKSEPFLYGYDRVDLGTRVVVVEGPIDSMFLSNAVASAGGSITRELGRTGLRRDGFTVCYDNEPRSTTTVYKIKKAIEAKFPVFIWPKNVLEKDFNDYFCKLVAGRKTEPEARRIIHDMVESRTYEGLEAELELSVWSKV